MTTRNIDDLKGLGAEINGNGRAYFDDIVTDNMFDALLELSAVVWTFRDRQIVLERILKDKGLDVSNEIEAYVPTDSELEERKTERDEMISRVFECFLRRPNREAAESPDDPSKRDIPDAKINL